MNHTMKPPRLASIFAGVFVVGLSITGVCHAQEQPPSGAPPATVLTDGELLHKYVWSALGPGGALAATSLSAFDQWRGSPRDWPANKSGYLRRWASDYTAAAIGGTTKYGVARLVHQDPSFTRCRCTAFFPRLRHAATSPFMARTSDGRRVFSLATVAGLAAENIIPAATWYPAPRGTLDGILHTTGSVGVKLGINIAHEFIPVPRWTHVPQPKAD
jgi:hypothetical protein